MNAISCLRTLCRAGLALVFVPTIIAQTVSPAGIGTAVMPSGQDVVVMTPFTVSAEKERGYLATETLAGMRLRTDLKDVGAAIDVLTDQFLNDVGAIDMLDAMKYVANMSYNEFPSDSDANNNAQWFQTGYWSRGISGSTVLTDFFENGSLPIDRYNTDNLTFLRGPNAILFGIGSPSGIVGASTKRASLGKNAVSLRFMVDQFGSRRVDFDLDHVLVKNKLGFRVAAVISDKQTFQQPSKVERNAVYGTVSYRPFRKTRITANVEWGEWNRLNVLNNLVADAYTPWVKAGKPTFNWVTGAGGSGWASSQTDDTKKTKFLKNYNTTAKANTGLQGVSSGQYLVYIEGSNLPIMDWRNMPRGSQHSFDVPNSTTWTPGTQFKTDNDKMANIPFTAENAIIDQDANIWSELNTNDLEYKRQSVFIEQNIVRNLDLELAVNRFETEYLYNFFSQNNTVFVDASEVLPDGRPNPYVGMPYIETGNTNGPNRIRSRNEHTTYRATLSYELNLDKYKISKNLGFGDYRFAGLYQRYERDEKYVRSRFVNATPLPAGGNLSLNNNVNRISRRYYLNPGESLYQYDYNSTPSQPNNPGGYAGAVGPITVEERSSDESPRYNLKKIESLVFAVQGAWWFSKDGWPHITSLYGMRHDTQNDRKQSFVRASNGEYPNAPGSLDIEKYGTWSDWGEFKANTKSYNITFRPISALRIFYNYSDIFMTPASATAVDVWGNSLRPTVGKTKDIGVKIDLFGDRLYLTATKYKTGTTDTIVDNTGNVRGPLNAIYETLNMPLFERPQAYRDDSTDGYEFSINAKPARDWNVRVAIGTQDTIISSTYEDWAEYFAVMSPLWEANKTTLVKNPTSTYTTIGEAADLARRYLADSRAIIGQKPTGQRDYNVTFNTSYSISAGALKGLRFGGGVRWQSANSLGYARDPNSAAGNFDFSRPFRGPEIWSTDFVIGYSRRILKNKIGWDIQLNLFNILNNDDALPRQAVDDGNGNPVYVRRYGVSPFSVQLTNAFRF